MSTTVDVRPAAYTAMSLTAYDAATTTVALDVAGGVELNPLLQLLIGTVGTPAAMVARAAIGIALVWLLIRLVESPRCRFGPGPLWVASGLLGVVAVWNTVQLAMWGAA
jgi:uncharacterized membrane protein